MLPHFLGGEGPAEPCLLLQPQPDLPTMARLLILQLLALSCELPHAISLGP